MSLMKMLGQLVGLLYILGDAQAVKHLNFKKCPQDI